MRPAQQRAASSERPQRPNLLATLAPVFAVFLSPLGIVVGVMALRQISRTGERGRGAATPTPGPCYHVS